MRVALLITTLVVALVATPTQSYRVIRSIPHDSKAFTQGLLYSAGSLWESTGTPGGGTRVREINTANGEVIQSTPRDDSYFGEGLAADDMNLYQLSWKRGELKIFSYPKLTFVTSIPYTGEGWGLTLNDSNLFIMSNGSDTITLRDSKFSVVKRVPIKDSDKPLKEINELEWANQKLYANIWYSDSIAVIDLDSGEVMSYINLKPLRLKAQATDQNQVVNGIAHLKDNQFWVTGKFWSKIFLIELTN